MKIALIPIDNRPVCYNLAKDIAAIDSDLELFLPDKKFLGNLYSKADTKAILTWLEELPQVDAIIISLDTIAYGGLIPSRRSKETLNDVRAEMENFKQRCHNKCSGKIYAFSSIMRISNNNVNEEEKEYWNLYGEKIFEYSYRFHKEGTDISEVPQEILNDYLATRQRNFQVNKMYLEWVKEGFFNTLIFSKDDCAEYGFNALEADILKKIIAENELNAQVKTGADEIPLALMARAICDFNNEAPKISPKFLAPEHTHLISNYEDISIEQSVKAQITLSGCECGGIDDEDADICLIVNNFEEHQGEIVMGVKTKHFGGKLDLPKGSYMIADVRFANGADNKFVEQLLKRKLDYKTFYGYSAWNTSANTLGSLLCAAVVKFFAKEVNEEAFKRLQLIRFLDDWAYQANVRQELKQKAKSKKQNVNEAEIEIRPDVRELTKLMLPFEKKLKKFLKTNPRVKYIFPWKRFFEVGVIIK